MVGLVDWLARFIPVELWDGVDGNFACTRCAEEPVVVNLGPQMPITQVFQASKQLGIGRPGLGTV